MATLLNYLTKLVNIKKEPRLTPEEKFLSMSTDLADLERRMKELRTASPMPRYRYWI